MKYQTMLTNYSSNAGFSDKSISIEEGRRIIMQDRPEELSIEEMNSFLTEGYGYSENYDGERFFLQDKYSTEEKDSRRALSLRAHTAMANQFTAYWLSGRPTTAQRYPEELIMGDDPVENLKIHDAFKNPAEHKEEVVKYINGLLKRLQDPDCADFLDSNPTDEQLVDNFGRIHEVSMIMTNMQNMRTLMQDAGISVETLGSDASKMQFTECQRIMDQYRLLTESYNLLEERLGMIGNPMYASVDIDDPNFQRVAFLQKYGYIDPFSQEKSKAEFLDMLSNGGDLQKDEAFFNLNIATNMLRRAGAEPENLMFRKVGPDGTKEPPKPYDPNSERGNILEHLLQEPGNSIELYDSTNPERSVLFSCGPESLHKNLYGSNRQYQQPEDPPRKPDVVKKPGAVKGFFNTITFGWAFNKDFKAYEDYEAAQKRYETEQFAYQKRKARTDVNNLKYTTDTIKQMRRELDERVKNGPEQPDRELQDLIALIENRSGVKMPDEAKANVTAMYEKAKAARESLQKDCDSGNQFKAGDRAYDIAAFAYLKNSAMKGELNETNYAAMSKDSFITAMNMMARCSGKTKLLAERLYLPATVEEKLLSRDGEDELAADIEKSTSVVIKKELEKKKELSQDDETLLQQVSEDEPIHEPNVYNLIEKSSDVPKLEPKKPQQEPVKEEVKLGSRSKTTDDLGLFY